MHDGLDNIWLIQENNKFIYPHIRDCVFFSQPFIGYKL